jgi:hypothetical protein
VWSVFSTFTGSVDESQMPYWIRHSNDKGKHHYHLFPCYYELILFKLPFNSQLIFTVLFVTSPEIVSRPPVSIYNAVSSWNREVLARRSLIQRWLSSMTEEGLLPTFGSLSSRRTLLLVLHWRIRLLQCSLPSAVKYPQSLATGLCPGNRQLTFVDYLLALNSVTV